jgi:hypothetical protein
VDPVKKGVAAELHACKINMSPLFNMNETFIVKPHPVPVPLAGMVGPVILKRELELNTKYRILNDAAALTFIVRLIIALLTLSVAVYVKRPLALVYTTSGAATLEFAASMVKFTYVPITALGVVVVIANVVLNVCKCVSVVPKRLFVPPNISLIVT